LGSTIVLIFWFTGPRSRRTWVSGRKIPCIKQRYTSTAGFVLFSFGFSAYWAGLGGGEPHGHWCWARHAQIVGPGFGSELRELALDTASQESCGVLEHPLGLGLGIDDSVMIGIFLDGSCTTVVGGCPRLGFALHIRRATLRDWQSSNLKHFPIHQPYHPHEQRAMFPLQGLHSRYVWGAQCLW
jgi:hypothetical protein